MGATDECRFFAGIDSDTFDSKEITMKGLPVLIALILALGYMSSDQRTCQGPR